MLSGRTFVPPKFGGSEAIARDQWEPLPWAWLLGCGGILMAITLTTVVAIPGRLRRLLIADRGTGRKTYTSRLDDRTGNGCRHGRLDGGWGCRPGLSGAVSGTLFWDAVAKDIDIATAEPPARVAALLTSAGLKAIPTGIDHGTVTAVIAGTPFEITTLRLDVETFGRRARVAYTDDWAADAERRGFHHERAVLRSGRYAL